MYDEATVGARLRELRRWRGMSMQTLADLAGLSQGHLSKLENGKVALDRRSHIAGLAAALRVSEVDLVGGPHLTPDPVQSAPHGHIPALRATLQANALMLPTTDWARPLADLTAAVLDELEPLRRACDYTAIGERLPDVLDELHVHTADPHDEQAQRIALRALVEACVCATFTAKNLGYPDLAYAAAARAAEAAHRLDEPVQVGKAAFLKVQTMPKTSQERTRLMAGHAADALEPYAGRPGALETLGMLTLSASLAAATLRDKAGAEHWLAEAARLAKRVPDEPMTNWQSFSTTNVGVWRVTIEVEQGAAGAAVLELTKGIDEAKLGRSSRKASFFADVGCGLARDRRTQREALHWFGRAEKVAPQRIRNSPTVREAVAVMLAQAKSVAVGRDLRRMAARMGIPH
ncbi:helix-turn-helix domain-containing protein [Actinomadura graeca]|uniref:Helix-turn-helix domain-containing protein n=1 Tax=Actinomadura graeca TaxID=2750812 RepID=A0ABX8QY42_9ACTN|nr:XRE family transcriptional regulator [Actinomadura graeca]QXJ21683.1 helix-turn-helix domain-containing protein [Actinomadura graeca]